MTSKNPAHRNFNTCSWIVLLVICCSSAFATKWYVDPKATLASDGTTWESAWTKLSDIKGVLPGDTVYISGGGDGMTQVYDLNGEFTSLIGYKNGSLGTPITYQIGQDIAHRGVAIFNRTGGGTQWLFEPSNVTFSGDAQDGLMHFRIQGYTSMITSGTSPNVRLLYIDCGNISQIGRFQGGPGLELAYCYAFINDMNQTRALAGKSTGTGYGQNSIHHNAVYCPRDNKNNGIGPDFFAFSGDGVDIYQNYLQTYPVANYTGGEHQDGWQSAGGHAFIRVFANTFIDIPNYAIFPEPTSAGGYSDMQIYNNLCINTMGNPTQAIAVSAKTGAPLKRVLVANNVADGYSLPFTFWNPNSNPDPTTANFTECKFINNVAVNSGSNIIDPSIVAATNVAVSSSDAGTVFVSYAARSSKNDYHLLGTAVNLVKQGTNLSSVFDSDASGSQRQPTGPWDIGAYLYSGVVSTPSPVLPPVDPIITVTIK